MRKGKLLKLLRKRLRHVKKRVGKVEIDRYIDRESARKTKKRKAKEREREIVHTKKGGVESGELKVFT